MSNYNPPDPLPPPLTIFNNINWEVPELIGNGGAGFQGLQGPAGGGTGGGGIGPQGFQGFQGRQGLGQQGNQGFIGINGLQGRQGLQGFDGLQGMQGIQGVQGTQGFQGHQGYQGIQGQAGSSTSVFPYRTETTSFTGDPGAGKFLWNNVIQTSATQINVSHETEIGEDIDPILTNVAVGTILLVQDATNSLNFQRFEINGTPIVFPNLYVVYPVVLLTAGGSPLPDNHKSLLFFIQQAIVGQQGVQGAQGFEGVQGLQGLGGIQGFQGSLGFQGAQGWQGVAGPLNTLFTQTYGATTTFDIDTNGGLQTVVLTASSIFAVTVSINRTFVLLVEQGGAGSYTVTWFSTIKWAGGVTPTLTTTVGKTDSFAFIRTSSGQYLGYVVGLNA